MVDIAAKTPADWRNFATRFPIAACRLSREDLKALYRLINERQAVYRDKIVAIQTQQKNETQEAFEGRKQRVYGACVTSVTVAAKNGELLTGNNERIFDAVEYWPDIKSVFFSTRSVPEAVINVLPDDRIILFLDFTQPPALDFSKLPTLPTPNESNFEISSGDEAWFTLSKGRLVEFFQRRKTGHDWIHRAAIYDFLLSIVGLPLAVWGTVEIGNVAPSIDKMNIFPRVLLYCYTFFVSLLLFRVLFSYARWVFPKVEVDIQGQTRPLRHRAAWALAFGALFWPAVYDVAKIIAGYILSK